MDAIPLDVRISLSPTKFEISEWHVYDSGHAEDELYWAKFNIVNGNMQVSVQTVRKTPDGTELRSPTIRYGAAVAQALTWFESHGQPVKAWPTEWSYMRPGEISTNLRVYYAGLGEGMTPEEAARYTPTGRVATALGFGEVTVLPHTWESDLEINPEDENVPPALRQQFPKQRAVFFPSGVPPASGPAGVPPAPKLPFLELVPPANVKRASPLPDLDLVPPANLPTGAKPSGVTIGPAATSGLRSDLAAGARSGAVSGGVALFGVLTSIGRQRFDRWISERQLQDLEPEIERRLNEVLPSGLALRATDPGKPVYANIAIRTSQPSTFEAETGGGARRYDLPIVRIHSVGFSHEARERTRRWQEWQPTFRIDWSETVSSVPLDDLVGPAEPPVCEP